LLIIHHGVVVEETFIEYAVYIVFEVGRERICPRDLSQRWCDRRVNPRAGVKCLPNVDGNGKRLAVKISWEDGFRRNWGIHTCNVDE
jgi:hypothetical protein